MSEGNRKVVHYKRMVQRATPDSEKPLSLVKAFVVGGLICMIGQGFADAGRVWLEMDKTTAGGFSAIMMVFLGALLTGLGVYDRIGRFAGGGSIVPITGFANSVVAPAMEFRREGLITGVGVKMFSLAGPVLVYGVNASILVGLIYYLFGYGG